MEKPDGGPAFTFTEWKENPEHSEWPNVPRTVRGMSLRDYFAAAALQGILAGLELIPISEIADGLIGGARISKVAYVYADAMLAEREKD